MNGIVIDDYVYLFDTNILIYLLNNRLPEKLPSGCYGYLVITEIELLSFPDLTATDAHIITRYLNDIVLILLTDNIKQITITPFLFKKRTALKAT